MEKTFPLSDNEVAYPRNTLTQLLWFNSPYAAYLMQWVPYHTELKKRRLKMDHDIKLFDGREFYNLRPNGNNFGDYKDEDIEFIRLSAKQLTRTWTDTSVDPPKELLDDFVIWKFPVQSTLAFNITAENLKAGAPDRLVQTFKNHYASLTSAIRDKGPHFRFYIGVYQNDAPQEKLAELSDRVAQSGGDYTFILMRESDFGYLKFPVLDNAQGEYMSLDWEPLKLNIYTFFSKE